MESQKPSIWSALSFSSFRRPMCFQTVCNSYRMYLLDSAKEGFSGSLHADCAAGRSFEWAVRRPNVQMEACNALLPPSASLPPSGSERVPHASSRVISFRSPHYTIPKSALELRSSHGRPARSSLCRRHRLLHFPSVPFRSLFSVRPSSSMNVPSLPSPFGGIQVQVLAAAREAGRRTPEGKLERI